MENVVIRINKLIIILLLLIYGCKNNYTVKPEKYIIPDDYIGNCVILYDQKGYSSLIVRGDTLVYELDKSGKLFTSFPYKERTDKFDNAEEQITFTFQNGQKIPYRYFIDGSERNPEDNNLQVFNGTIGKIGNTTFYSFIIDLYTNKGKYNQTEFLMDLNNTVNIQD
jgi:hypothetical protein